MPEQYRRGCRIVAEATTEAPRHSLMRIGVDQGDPIILALENFVGMLRSHLSVIPRNRRLKPRRRDRNSLVRNTDSGLENSPSFE